MNLFVDLQKWAITATEVHLDAAMLSALKDKSAVATENAKLVSAYTFTYDVDGLRVAGFLVTPKQAPTEKMPVIIFNRGGTGDYDLVPDSRLFTRLAYMSRWGYTIIGSQYPGNTLSEGQDERGGSSDVASVLKLYDFITQSPGLDQARIGMFGHSRGGMMTYLCLKQVDWIKAALTVGGLVDLDSSLAHRPEMKEVLDMSFDNTESERHNRSVVHWADQLKKVPLCILHGGADTKIPPADAIRLGRMLEAAHHPYALHIIKDGDHGLMNTWRIRDQITREWFSKEL